MTHPNLESQIALNGGNLSKPTVGGRSIAGAFAGAGDQLSDVVDATPRFVAGLLLGAVATLFVLRVAGFRFSFGAELGAGS